MPAAQRGSVEKRPTGWAARYYDEHGIRQFVPGFQTKTAARAWLDAKVDEVAQLRRGDAVQRNLRARDVNHLVDTFLERHGATIDDATRRKLTAQLRKLRAAFGDRHPDSIMQIEWEDYRAALPSGSRHDVFRASRQCMKWGVDRHLITRNGAAAIQNPKRKRHERRAVVPFETWEEVETVGEQLERVLLERGSFAAHVFRAIPVFAVGTGLRPEEWIALERDDIDRAAGVIRVRRRYSGGELKEGGKTAGSVRDVPLRLRVIRALDSIPPRIDSPLLFPAPKGGYIDLDNFRKREWSEALKRAGLAHRGPYAMRHTFATWTIESGLVRDLDLAELMGTSLRELEDTYYRQLQRRNGTVRASLDAYDQAVAR